MGKPHKAIEQAANYAAAKSKPRLKNGTNPKAKPAKDVSLPQPRWDQGAMGRANRLNLVTEERGHINEKTGKRVNPNGVKGVRRVDMLEVYYNRGWITKRGYSAGCAFRDAWANTQRGPSVDMSADKVDRTPKPDASIDIQIDRVSKLVKVSRKIRPDDYEILHQVACCGNAIGGLRQYRGRKHEAGKIHLHDALERFADAMGG